MKKLLLILLCLPMIGFGQETYLCTSPEDDEDGKRWYKFDYDGRLSTQVRNEFKYLILHKLGIKKEETHCIEDIKVWYEEKVVPKETPKYAAPKIYWWDGFKVSCDCIRPSNPYKTENLKIAELDHPFANPEELWFINFILPKQ